MERLTIEYCGNNVPRELCSIDRLGGADDCDLCYEYCKVIEEGNVDCGDCAISKCFNKLSEYEDLEEQGKLLKLPCAVGDTVYCIYSRYTKCSAHNQEFEESSCLGCESECDSEKECYVQEQRAYSLDWIVTQIVCKHFGKIIFLTREEAEAVLKELNH